MKIPHTSDWHRFLCRVATSPRRHVAVTAGNHDSPSFLNAPRELLKFLNVHVVAGLRQDGKLSGVISHVTALKERIGAQIQVIPETGGRSSLAGPG